MFRVACEIARGFTFPVVLFRKQIGGTCSASIGSMIVVNDEGWIVTAGHIVTMMSELAEGEKQALQHDAAVGAIKADASLNAKDRSKKLASLGRMAKDATHRAASFLGFPGCQLLDAVVLNHIDLGVGRLHPFDKSAVRGYPEFKDPTKDFETGSSLCKYGYPFSEVRPTWDDVDSKFVSPAATLPLFPIEGIYTREVDVELPAGITSPFPLKYVETSSPGLKGQSGGPTFDIRGAIWAVQSQTQHFPLGFQPTVKDGNRVHTEHQFFNVGWGVHAATVIGFLNERGIKHRLSAF